MTLPECVWALDGWNEMKEETTRETWELARLGWFFSVKPWADRSLTPERLLRFPWEGAVVEEIDKEQFKSFPDTWPG